MNLFKSLTAAATKAAAPSAPYVEITSDVLRGGQIKILNNQAVLYGSEVSTLIQKSYLSNTDLYSIIQYIVRKSLRAKYFNYEVKDEKALSDYRLLKSDATIPGALKEAGKIRTKALVNTAHTQIDGLLCRPNPEQTFKQFASAAHTYKLLTGERMIQKIEGLYPVSQLFALPPNQMEVLPGDTYLSIGGYTYIPTKRDFKPEEILFSKMFHPSLNGYGEELRGLSPLVVMALTIQKSNEGTLSGLKQYQNAGPPGLLSLWDEDAPLTDAQAKEHEAKLARRGGSANRGKVNITGMRAEWVEMGLSPVDLDALESVLSDLRAMCRGYNLDSKLFNDPAASTMSNQLDAGKAAIVNAVIPAVEDLGDDLNQIIEPYNLGGKQYFIDADVTHFPELAEDLDKIMDRMMKGPFTGNQVLEAMHYEANPSPLMNEPIMDGSRVPLSQWVVDMGAPPKNDNTY